MVKSRSKIFNHADTALKRLHRDGLKILLCPVYNEFENSTHFPFMKEPESFGSAVESFLQNRRGEFYGI